METFNHNKTVYRVADTCERCGAKNRTKIIIDKDLRTVHIELVPAKTKYNWDGKGENPNRPLSLCKWCKWEYNDHWDAMWKDYYSGCM